MATYNVMTLVSGDPRAKRVPATTATAIQVGNHLVLTSNKAALPSAMSDAGTKAQNQEAAHDVYLGVALDAKPAGSDDDILVASAGEHKFACAAIGSGSDIGAYVGLAGTGSAGAVGVSDTLVEIVATANLAIGRLSRTAATGATTLYVEIAGVLTTTQAGPQTMA
jgi:hypothetical protein